jgi:diacylglycerol kinase family enzyme
VLALDDDPGEIARAAPAGALGMAGGDGSLAPVAQVAIEEDKPFVVVPFGTRNHFARDLGLDRDDPLGALQAFLGGHERGVDVGA